jgi:phage tail sheath gpL-like
MSTITLPSEIITSDKTPRTAVAFDKTSGAKQTSDTARLVLLVGQQVAAATVAPNTPTDLYREDDGANYFGAGSIIDVATRAAFLANPFVKLTAVGVADAGVKATGTVTFVGNAGVSTIYRLRVAGVEYAVSVTVGDTPTIMATNLAALGNADPSCPVTATSALGVVTLTADNGGTIGNGIQLRGAFDAPVTQVVTVATLSGTSLTGGTGSASLVNALASSIGKRYHIVAPLIDDAIGGATAKASADSEGDAEHAHGQIFVQVLNAPLSAQTTMATTLNANRGLLCSISGTESWSPAMSAATAAVMSREEVATRPYNGTVVNGILPPPVATRWIRTETRALLDNGCTPLVVVPGEQVAIMRAVTTGVKNQAGNYDYSTLDVTKIQGFDFFRDNIILMFNTNYPKARWADSDPDGLLPTDVATPEKVTIDLVDVARDMESLGIVQNVDALKAQFVVQKVGTQCQFSVPGFIVDGMHEKLGKIVNILRLPLS